MIASPVDLQRAILAAAICISFLLPGCSSGKKEPSTGADSSENILEKVTEKGPVKLVVSVTPRAPRLSDLVQMDVDVTAQADVEITPPEFGQAVGDFMVRDYSEVRDRSVPQPENGAKTRRFRYQLEPVFAGRHLIRSVGVEFIDRRSSKEAAAEPVLIESDPIEVQITSELGDQAPSLANLDPMVPPKPLTDSSVNLWLALAGILIAAVALVLWSRRRRIAGSTEPRKLTPEEIAQAALKSLLSEDLPRQGLFKDFYLRLTGIVRYYIEGTTGLKAPEQTTEEFLRAMRSRNVFLPEKSARLAEFLEAADMVKYAGQQPDEGQIELSIVRAREFVEVRETSTIASNAAAVEA